MVDPLENGLPRPMEGQAGELRVEVVRRLPQFVGRELLADVDHFLDDVPAARHDHHQHARGAQRDELDPIEHGRLVGRPDREPDLARRLGHDVRDLRQHRIDEAPGAVAAEPRFDGARGPRRALRLEQEVHVKAVTAVGRDPARGSVRLLDEAFMLELGEDVADRRRGHAESGGGSQRRRRDGFARRDIFAHERRKHAPGTVDGFH